MQCVIASQRIPRRHLSEKIARLAPIIAYHVTSLRHSNVHFCAPPLSPTLHARNAHDRSAPPSNAAHAPPEAAREGAARRAEDIHRPAGFAAWLRLRRGLQQQQHVSRLNVSRPADACQAKGSVLRRRGGPQARHLLYLGRGRGTGQGVHRVRSWAAFLGCSADLMTQCAVQEVSDRGPGEGVHQRQAGGRKLVVVGVDTVRPPRQQ